MAALEVRPIVIFAYKSAHLNINSSDLNFFIYVLYFCYQVYVRRAYIAYELNSVQHRQLKDNTCVVEFQFMLPTSHPNRYDAGKLSTCSVLALCHPSEPYGTVDSANINLF